MPKTDEERDSQIIDQFMRELELTAEFKMLVEKLKPLMELILSSQSKKDNFRNSTKQLPIRFRKSGERMSLLKEDSKAGYDSQLNTLRKAFLFLALFETTVTNIVDSIVFLLVLNEHDFFIQYRREYAKSLDDLDAASLGEKLDFLNFHGFSFFTKNINRTLRNKIAHMDFDIEEKGAIIVKEQRYYLQEELSRLEAVVMLAAKALRMAGFAL
jgi:hypothetical protein